MGIRKNVVELSDEERTVFVNAVKKLKEDGKYDDFVRQHVKGFGSSDPVSPKPPAHFGPGFLPWHREFLRRFEIELQKMDPKGTVTLPYWDWSAQSTDSLFDPNGNFMGGNGSGPNNRVMTGPFSQWTLTVRPDGTVYFVQPDGRTIQEGVERDTFLKRALGSMGTLPTSENVDEVLKYLPYDKAVWHADPFMPDPFGGDPPPDEKQGFRKNLEFLIHNPAHMWVGGSMMTSCSPNDPVFWLHHCNIDRLWAEWQTKKWTDTDFGWGFLTHFGWPYLPPRGTSDVWPGHSLDDPMPPWDKEDYPPTPRSVLNHLALGYEYDNEYDDEIPHPYLETRSAISWNNGSDIRLYVPNNPKGPLTEYMYDDGRWGIGKRWTDTSDFIVSATEWDNAYHIRLYVGKVGNAGKIQEYRYDHGGQPEWRDDGPVWDVGGKITGVAAVSWNDGSNIHIRVYFSYVNSEGLYWVGEKRWDGSEWATDSRFREGTVVSAISWDPTGLRELQIRVYIRDNEGKIHVWASWDGKTYTEIPYPIDP
jgi:hypothetical protein